MSNMSNKLIVLIVLVYLLVVSVVILNFYPAPPIGFPDTASADPNGVAGVDGSGEPADRLELMFSHPEHFYDTDIAVSIFASQPGAVIYYTVDGSEPTVESPVYTEPVLFPATKGKEDVGVYPLKAIAVYGDTITRPLVHTYFVSADIHDRFDVMVFSLSTNDEYLYDYDTGILVEGRTREEYVAANPREHINPPAPANFNWRGMESERPVYVEVFETDGQRVIAQAVGMRVQGGWSRAALYKSLRLIPRSMYEPNNGRFQYDFYPDDVRDDGFGTPITRYDQVVLINNANDRDFAMLRQEVNYALARSAGLRVIPPSRGAAVFLNGEYYGFAWLEVNVNEQYLEDIYSAPSKDFQVVGNGEWHVVTNDEDAAEAINHLNSFQTKDFSDDKVLAEFEELADIDDLLLYYAYQTYVGNRDWPGGNLKRWRYIGPQVEGLAPELDGRWRYVTFDLDFTLALYVDVNANDPAFKDFLTPRHPRYSSMLDALFVRPDIVDKYAMLVCDIAANILTAENVAEQIDRFYAEAYREIGFSIETGKYAHWVSHGSVEYNHANMILYAEERTEHFLQGMREYFEWDDEMFTVEVSGADAIIGSQPGTSSTYFAHLTIPLRPALSSKFEVFDHWVLDGKVIDTPEITVSVADAHDGVVRLELVTRVELPSLIIKDAYGTSERNGAVLYNTSGETVNTAGLFLTNDLSNPYLWAMPMATVAPGESLEFSGRSSRDDSDLHTIQMGFNVRAGRVLFLCDESGDVLDWFVVN